MRIASTLACTTLALALAGGAGAQELSVGVAVPLSETAELLGEQMVDGARVAADTFETATVELAVADDRCSSEGGEAAARRFVDEDVGVVAGFLCTEAIEAALPILEEAGIPVVTPGVRTASLTDRRQRTGWPVFRLAPRADAEAEAVADILAERWSGEHFAIVDDGTIYGRELAENLRAAAELAGLEPVFLDTFRPQQDNQIGLVGRLDNAGATHVFVGGDRSDIAIIARDAAKLGYDFTIAGGEALRAEGGEAPLPAGILMVGLPEWADIASYEAVEAISNAGVIPEGYVVPGFAALEVALTALVEARRSEGAVAETLQRLQFDTALGAVSFDGKGDMTLDLYRLFRYDGESFVEAG